MQTHEMHREVEKIGETLTSLNTILVANFTLCIRASFQDIAFKDHCELIIDNCVKIQNCLLST